MTPPCSRPDRLSWTAPELARKLRAAPPEQQRRAALTAATLAVERTGVEEPCLERALALLHQGTLDPSVRAEVKELYERLDERAFDLDDEAQRLYPELYHGKSQDPLPPEMLAASAAARRAAAATAVWFALAPDPVQAALEATVEAKDAFGADRAQLLASVERVLDQ